MKGRGMKGSWMGINYRRYGRGLVTGRFSCFYVFPFFLDGETGDFWLFFILFLFLFLFLFFHLFGTARLQCIRNSRIVTDVYPGRWVHGCVFYVYWHYKDDCWRYVGFERRKNMERDPVPIF